MTNGRTSYLRTIYNTADLDEGMLQVLLLMATYCNPERMIRVRAMARPDIATKLHWGLERTRNAMRRLEDSKLLRTVRHEGNQWYLLPTEEELARYIAPPNPTKKQKHEKLTKLANAAQAIARRNQVQARTEVHH